MDIRRECAKKAMVYIKNDSIIGLGAGRNILALIEVISEEVKNGFKVKVITPSDTTREICFQRGIEVLPTHLVEEVDVAFDGCGEVDKNFYASKGGGGVFLKEKIIGAMAKDYILLIDEEKLKDTLTPNHVVSIEVTKASLAYVNKKVKELGGSPIVRKSVNKDGYLVTDDGNILIDISFENISDFKKLNDDLRSIVGVVETSIFTEEVTKLIVASESGIRVLERN